ncbi:MAG: hypothetical protein AB2A00_29730 [Myxococcota bacterium]
MRALRFLSIRLRSRPETQGLVDGVQKARKELGADDDAWEQAQWERVAATAEVTTWSARSTTR